MHERTVTTVAAAADGVLLNEGVWQRVCIQWSTQCVSVVPVAAVAVVAVMVVVGLREEVAMPMEVV